MQNKINKTTGVATARGTKRTDESAYYTAKQSSNRYKQSMAKPYKSVGADFTEYSQSIRPSTSFMCQGRSDTHVIMTQNPKSIFNPIIDQAVDVVCIN